MCKLLRFSVILMFALIFVFPGCWMSGGSDDGDSSDPVITIAAIPGVTVPVRDEEPVTTEINTNQYHGTITWSPDENPFSPETVYTANIELTAKDGYTFNGVSENFFTVAGAETVTNPANSGFVKAIFPETGEPSDINVNFISATEYGGTSKTDDSTGLILEFDVDPETLTADNITVDGATKGIMTGTGLTRNLEISDITVANGLKVCVTITSPDGYAIKSSIKYATVYRYNRPVTFLSATQDGGSSGIIESSSLILEFDEDPETLQASNIFLYGATKGNLSGTGTTRTLEIDDINVANGSTVTVSVRNPPGYEISGTTKNPVVYRISKSNMDIGMNYRGGILIYILQPGDTGYDSNVPHGIIAAKQDQHFYISWATPEFTNERTPGLTMNAIGAGPGNTDKIMRQHRYASPYRTFAARAVRSYNGGGYNDWYLPSIDELYKLYIIRDSIEGLAENGYWSSTEYGASKAKVIFFSINILDNVSKDESVSVRAFRNF